MEPDDGFTLNTLESAMHILSRWFVLPCVTLALAAWIACVGCGGTSDTAADPTHEGHDHGEAGGDAIDLSHLSPEDQKAALAQRICPVGTLVSEEDVLLGSGGMKAVKVNVEGRDVFLCCDGCESSLRDEPAKYFAVLDGGADTQAPSPETPAAESTDTE